MFPVIEELYSKSESRSSECVAINIGKVDKSIEWIALVLSKNCKSDTHSMLIKHMDNLLGLKVLHIQNQYPESIDALRDEINKTVEMIHIISSEKNCEDDLTLKSLARYIENLTHTYRDQFEHSNDDGVLFSIKLDDLMSDMEKTYENIKCLSVLGKGCVDSKEVLSKHLDFILQYLTYSIQNRVE